MARKKYSVEQIIIKLREIEVLCSSGSTVAEAARQSGITEQTYYRWRKALESKIFPEARSAR